MRAATAQGLTGYYLACGKQLGFFRWGFYDFFFSFLGFVFLGFLCLLTKLSLSQPTFLTALSWVSPHRTGAQ